MMMLHRYSWSYRLSDVVSALNDWAAAHRRDPTATWVWICSLCLNQHRMHTTLTPEQLAEEFNPRVIAIGRILPLLVPWNEPVYVQRAWCLFELYTAICNARSVAINVFVPPSQRSGFLEAMAAGNYAELEAVLEEIHAEEATSTEPADVDAIRALIRSLPGGFPTLNEMVRGHLRRWFEGHGAVLTSSRAHALRTASQSRGSTRLSGVIESRMTSPEAAVNKGNSSASASPAKAANADGTTTTTTPNNSFSISVRNPVFGAPPRTGWASGSSNNHAAEPRTNRRQTTKGARSQRRKASWLSPSSSPSSSQLIQHTGRVAWRSSSTEFDEGDVDDLCTVADTDFPTFRESSL